ncbi:hypothetical protein RHSIM_Rhsim10G0071500 [Rhododendron simsii]|uniref:Uncharacterized protein n=1 Tax=Rhododendron simsii TaxID=118357 RepID=A0A834LD40_RHOSS|nr:hypothetical protein RHSIM_Rhsim10G0071500 [Rhododendron simsii]
MLRYGATPRIGIVQVKQAVIGSHGLDVQYHGINVLESLILNWDFRYSTNAVTGGKGAVDVYSAEVRYEGAKRSDCILVQPGPSWRDVWITSFHIWWLLSLYGPLKKKFLCEDNGQMQDKHLLRLLSGIIKWVSPPDAIANGIECGVSESEMLDGCRALLAIATVTKPLVFDQLLKSISPFGTLSLLSALTCEVVKVLMANFTVEETWSWVARDILLDTWTAVLMLPPEGVNAVANLFALIVESELKAASASAVIDESESEYLQASITGMDARLSSYGLIA